MGPAVIQCSIAVLFQRVNRGWRELSIEISPHRVAVGRTRRIVTGGFDGHPVGRGFEQNLIQIASFADIAIGGQTECAFENLYGRI